MFQHLEPAAPQAREEIEFFFEGAPLRGCPGMTLAAALLATAAMSWRGHSIDTAPRGPVCLMGVCFECLVEVEGLGTVRACLTPLRAGMKVRQLSPSHSSERAT